MYLVALLVSSGIITILLFIATTGIPLGLMTLFITIFFILSNGFFSFILSEVKIEKRT